MLHTHIAHTHTRARARAHTQRERHTEKYNCNIYLTSDMTIFSLLEKNFYIIKIFIIIQNFKKFLYF